MELAEQVVNLELSRKLKELNVEQESLFYWIDNDSYSDNIELLYAPTKEYIKPNGEIDWPRDENSISAFTVAEILNLIPLIACNPIQLLKGTLFPDGLIYCCRSEYVRVKDNIIFSDNNPANACAKFMIYLIENNSIGIIK